MDIPQTYKNAALCNMASGALIIVIQLIWAFSLLMSCVGALALPIPFIAMAIGAWQIVVGYKMNQGERVPNAATAAIVGAVTGFLSFSIPSGALGIFAYLQLQDDQAKGYLEG